jgi:hypothetical protein
MSTGNGYVGSGTELVFLRTLHRNIDELSATRRTYSQLHELAHLALAAPGANDTGMVLVFDSLRLLSAPDHDHLTNLATAFSAGVPQPRPVTLSPVAEIPPAGGMPMWSTRAFTGMTIGAWFGFDLGSLPTGQAPSIRNLEASRPARSRVVFHIPVGTGALLVDGWAAMTRVIDSVLAAVLLMRLLVRAGLQHGLNGVGFVLVILATCRHYGHRSEPDDHASLLIHRLQVSIGSCLPA